ncbi:MAG: RpiB/LacA/LacB family sugar-phosphate isomerase [Bacteroidales bacterium]|jgi:ribose 5-phosphate isomerase B|nr:RpiB/LacA/LacB family sugar-phosphate isomerase [Bacteroidales bacterium]
MQTLLIAADHAGFETKEFIKKALEIQGYTMKDYGTFSTESMDYPDVVHPLAQEINAGNCLRGIILCGSGNGVNMVANKYPYVRSALCWNEEIASLARKHNDANIIAIPARFVDKQMALKIVTVFLNTDFESGRHQERRNKIAATSNYNINNINYINQNDKQ